jgi:CorA-like Mg2+ transporter protein
VLSFVATIFVPLTFVTGFFGMSFCWLTDQTDSPIAFWLLGFVADRPRGTVVAPLGSPFLMGDRG